MNNKLIGASLLASLALAGCSTLSMVDSEGKTDEPVFPDVEDVHFEDGSYPNLANLRQVGDGVTRDQLYALLGRPHFAEGFRVIEWDYLFHFNTPAGRETCQFKVLFDEDKIGRSFYWKPAECADLLNDEPAQPFSLSGDVGFGFDSAVLTVAGQEAVRDIAEQLKQAAEGRKIVVSGHTDRLGNAASNQQLSQQRAEAVQAALVAQGIPAETIQARGLGQEEPVMQCDQQDRSSLIACLAANRRVSIEVQD